MFPASAKPFHFFLVIYFWARSRVCTAFLDPTSNVTLNSFQGHSNIRENKSFAPFSQLVLRWPASDLIDTTLYINIKQELYLLKQGGMREEAERGRCWLDFVPVLPDDICFMWCLLFLSDRNGSFTGQYQQNNKETKKHYGSWLVCGKSPVAHEFVPCLWVIICEHMHFDNQRWKWGFWMRVSWAFACLIICYNLGYSCF